MPTDPQISLPAAVRITRVADEILQVHDERRFSIPLRRNADGLPELLMLEQPTNSNRGAILSVNDALGINGQTQISLERANRINPMAEDKCGCRTPKSISEDDCNLCNAAAALKEACGSVDNPRPFGPLIHKVVMTKRHVESADCVSVTEIRRAWEEFYSLTHGPAELDGLTVGMNLGAYLLSGASQVHFHYQVTGLGSGNYNAGDSLGALCEAYADQYVGADYFEDYMRAVRKAGLLIKENRHAALIVPFAQRFKSEMQIIALDRGVGNLRDTNEDQRAALAEIEHHAMQILATEKLHSFNEVWYMTRFSTDNRFGQRLVISLCPRTSIYAMYELSHNFVVDELPWDSAAILKKHSQAVDKEYPVSRDGQSSD